MTVAAAEPAGTPPVVAVRGVSKSFAAVEALRGVDLDLHRGQVVGLVGDNGAGKSTLIRCIAGIHAPDSGVVEIDGKPVALNAEVARELGIETVHQGLSLVETMDVAENFFINRERVRSGRVFGKLGILDKRRMYRETRDALARASVDVGSLRRPVRTLSGGQRQVVAVMRSIHWSPRLVMMDEPTAALGVEQSATVLRLIRSLAESGIAVVFVSHNMEHVYNVTHRIVVLRHGRLVADLVTSESESQEAVGYITGSLGT